VVVGEAENAFSQRMVGRMPAGIDGDARGIDGSGRTPIVGRYRLYEPIAAGGTATVHYGRMLGPAGFARTVAIKRLHREYARDPEFVAMFMDEARLAARVQHPNVVQTLDVVAAEGELFIVMEYLPAVSLSQLLLAAKSLDQRVPPAVAAAIVSGVLRGLHAAHEATDEDGEPLDIVHRDVSPQNVLVGADGTARVVDFGIAKATGRAAGVTREGQVKGKFAYMAPEQITNVGVSRQSDVFAASIVFWELLTGQRLFQAESEPALLAAVLSAPIPAPSTLAAQLGPDLDRIVLRGLAREISVRYSSGREMALDIEAHTTVASGSHVGPWVEGLASDELARRAARVAEIESESRSARVSAATILANPREGLEGATEAPRVAVAVERRKRASVLALVVAAMLVSVGAGFGFRSAHTAPLRGDDGPASPPTATAPPPPPGPAVSEVASPRTLPTTPPATPSRIPSAGPVRPPSVKPGPARSAAPSAVPRTDCDPPYYADSQGHLIYKPECFR
jgi:serine/threonine-protein kinase